MANQMMQSSPEQIRNTMQEARNDGAPAEFLAILNQILTSKTGAPGFPRNAITDNAGRFSFPGVPAGNYMLTAEREGFFGTSARGTNARSKVVSTPVNVTTRPMADLVLTLTPGGRINGQLRDEKGAPLPNVVVRAFTRLSVWCAGSSARRLSAYRRSRRVSPLLA